MRRIAVLIAVLLGLAPLAPRAAEIDSITGRAIPLRDSSRALEDRLNRALEAGVARANESATRCDEEALYDAVRDAFASPFIGHFIAESLNDDAALDRRRVLRVDSIYRDLGLLDNISVHWKDLSAVIRVGDTLIGVDKIGHFLVEGWGYFEVAIVDREGASAAMEWGEGTEDTYFGRYTTGVRSYADLVANFEGMRFWQRLIGTGPDPLRGGRRMRAPHVRCGRGLFWLGERRWRVARDIDLDDYVTPAWDEAVNCCAFRTPAIQARVEARIAERADADGVDYTCPVDPEACARARARYGDWAPRLLHPACLDARPPPRPWWKFWR